MSVESATYYFEVAGISQEYSFSVAYTDKFGKDPFWEFHNLKIDARCVHPIKLAGRSAKIEIIAIKRLDTQKDMLKPLERVGEIQIRGAKFKVDARLPDSVCWHLGAAIADGRIRYAMVQGPAPFRGRGDLTHIDFKGPGFNLAEHIKGD